MEENQDQISQVSQSPDGQASQPEPTYADIVKGEAAKPQDGAQGAEGQGQNASIPDEEREIELPGSRKVKVKDALEWEKGYMRQQDYTKKTQSVAEFRKSLEESFGRTPEIEEIRHLGKLVQNYYKDPNVQKIVDQIIAGDFRSLMQAQPGSQGANKEQANPEYTALRQEIENLKAQLEQREFLKLQDSAKRDFDSWVAKQKQTNSSFEVTEEMDKVLGHLIPAVSNLHPEWDNHKVLDEAFRLANIDNLEKSVRDKVLQSADESKKTNPPKITSKAPQKSDNEMSYKEMFLSAQGS